MRVLHIVLVPVAIGLILAVYLLLSRDSGETVPRPEESFRERDEPNPLPASDFDTETPTFVQLSGYVFDSANGHPVTTAKVLLAGKPGSMVARTDGRGAFRMRMPELRGADAELIVEAAGYLTARVSIAKKRISPSGRIRTVWLDRPLRIPGLVTDLNGDPIQGATVLIEGAGRPFTSSRSGEIGLVTVRRSLGRIGWRAWGPEHAPVDGELDANGLPEKIVIELEPGLAVNGLVVDARGAPQDGVRVYSRRHGRGMHTLTGEEGGFRWPLKAGHTAVLIAEWPGLRGWVRAVAGAKVRIVLLPENEVSIPQPSRYPSDPERGRDPAPGPGEGLGTVMLTALDEQGRPVPGAWVTAQVGTSIVSCEVTDHDGRCSMRLPAGAEVSIRCRHLLAGEAEARALVGAGESENVRLVHRRGDSGPRTAPAAPWCADAVTGRVLDHRGLPVEGVEVDAPYRFAEYLVDTTDRRGRYCIEGLPPGESTWLETRLRGYPVQRARAVAGGSPADIHLPGRGTIRMSLDPGSPEEPDFLLWSALGPAGPFLTDRDPVCRREGASLCIDCPAGVHVLSFRIAPGGYTLYPEVAVPAGGEVVLSYDFPKFGTVTGSVTDPGGSPVQGAEIRLAETGGRLTSTRRTGQFRAASLLSPDLPAGIHRLLVIAEGFAPALTRPVDLRREEYLDIRLERGGTLEGTLLGSKGVPIPGHVQYLPEFGRPLGRTEARADGAFELGTALPAGTVRISVEVPGWQPIVREVRITAGRANRVQFHLP